MLAHDLATLGFDGRSRHSTERRCAYAAALLYELMGRELLIVGRAGAFGLRGAAPTDGAMAVTAPLWGWTDVVPVTKWVYRLMRRGRRMEHAIVADLVATGVVADTPVRILGLPITSTWSLRDIDARDRVVHRVRDAAAAPASDAPTADDVLLGLVRAAKLLHVVWPDARALAALRPEIMRRTQRVPLGREAATVAHEIVASAAAA